MFKKLKQFAFGQNGGVDEPRKRLVIHVKKSAGGEFREMVVANEVYPLFKILLRDLANMHNADLELVEDSQIVKGYGTTT